jgi:MtN3 and saliva related transmembrane protein
MIEAIGFIATIILAVSSLPQVYTTFKEKTTQGLSLTMILMWTIGCLLMLVYVYLTTKQIPLMINYSFVSVINCVLLIAYYKYRK